MPINNSRVAITSNAQDAQLHTYFATDA